MLPSTLPLSHLSPVLLTARTCNRSNQLKPVPCLGVASQQRQNKFRGNDVISLSMTSWLSDLTKYHQLKCLARCEMSCPVCASQTMNLHRLTEPCPAVDNSINPESNNQTTRPREEEEKVRAKGKADQKKGTNAHPCYCHYRMVHKVCCSWSKLCITQLYLFLISWLLNPALSVMYLGPSSEP